jgi:hypothetical protein
MFDDDPRWGDDPRQRDDPRDALVESATFPTDWNASRSVTEISSTTFAAQNPAP